MNRTQKLERCRSAVHLATLGRLRPARTDVADVFAGAGDGNSATYGSAHRRGGGCDGGGGGSEQGFISDHGRIAPTGESVNAAEILRRSSTNAASGAFVPE